MLSRISGDISSVFDRFDLAGRQTVIVAVSGGGDSTALLLLLQNHIHQRDLPTRLVAVTIDHGLRPESAMEARAIEAFSTARGITHRTLRWEGEKPATGLSAAAREARYALLGQAADAAGTDVVLTGHTLNDQMETVAMRRVRGEGRGLAGMAPATLHQGRTWILRPLLETSRGILRDYLRMQDISWIEDPSNENPCYERVRARNRLARQDDADADIALDRIKAAQAGRIALGKQAAGLIDSHSMRASPGLYRIGRQFFESTDFDAALYAFRILLATAGGEQHLPEITKTRALCTEIRSRCLRATLSRTVIDARKRHVWMHRERRGLPAMCPASRNMIWDNRFRVTGGGETLQDVLVAPGASFKKGQTAGCDTPASLVAAALAAEPVLSREGTAGLEAAGSPPSVSPTPVVAPFLDFLPSFDLAPARAMARLTGSGNVPMPPLAA